MKAMNRVRISLCLVAVLALSLAISASPERGRRIVSASCAAVLQRAGGVPSPRDVLGFDPGDDRKLADWGQIVDYFKRLAGASNRVSLHEAGLTTERRPFIYALISSEDNIRNLSRIRDGQRMLADPRLIRDGAERERLIRETPAVVAIT